MKIKKVNITIQIPKDLDDAYRLEARQRMVSKSLIIREILFTHVRQQRQQPAVKVA